MIKIICDFLWVIISLIPYCIFFIINLNKENSFNLSILGFSFLTLVVGALLTKGLILFYLKGSSVDTLEVSHIKPAEASYIPVYISYFIITLGISDIPIFIIVTISLVLFILLTKVFYFNVFAYLWGYHFYEATSKKGIEYMLILKQKDLKQIAKISNLRRLNNFAFMERE